MVFVPQAAYTWVHIISYTNKGILGGIHNSEISWGWTILPPTQPNKRKTNEQNNDLCCSPHLTSHLICKQMCSWCSNISFIFRSRLRVGSMVSLLYVLESVRRLFIFRWNPAYSSQFSWSRTASCCFWMSSSNGTQMAPSRRLYTGKPPTWTLCPTTHWPTNLRWSRHCVAGQKQSAQTWPQRTRRPGTLSRP